MRILYVTDGIAPYVIGGMQTISRVHIEWLVAAGHDVLLVTSRIREADRSNLPCRSIVLPWPNRRYVSRLSPFRYADELIDYSHSIIPIAAEFKPELVYSEGPLLDLYLEVPAHQRPPTIFHPHGLEMFQHKGSLWEDAKSFPLRRIIARHCRRADLVVSLGGRITSLIKSAGARPERIAVIPNSAPAADATKPMRDNGRRLLFVGRPEARKGVKILLDAIKSVDDVTLDLVGMESYPGQNNRNIHFHGATREINVILQHYMRANFLLVPSYAEGMPTVILEAFSTGLPAIASDVGAINELVIDGKTGFLVEPGNSYALRAAIMKALTLSEESYSRFCQNCLTLAQGPHSPAAVRKKLFEMLERARATRIAL